MAVKRIHVGGSMRSGTTLLSSLINDCFAIDIVHNSEVHLWRTAPRGASVVFTKYPGDETMVRHVLYKDDELWFIYMLRDPRDVVVSFHGMDTTTYFTNLRHWKESYAAAHEMRGCSRFLEIRYEDLVRDPDEVQKRLMDFMPFLERTGWFSQWGGSSSLSNQYTQAMRGARKVAPSSIGAWRQHKGRVLAQIQLHGDISDILIETGYEPDKSWLRELDGVEPDMRAGKVADLIPIGKAVRRKIRERLHALLYLCQRMFLER